MTSVFALQNSVRLCLTSFCNLRPNLPDIPVTTCLFIFCILIPYVEKDLFIYLMSVLEGLIVFIEPFNSSFFGINGWGIRVIVLLNGSLEMNQNHSVIFEIVLKYYISYLFILVNNDGCSNYFKEFLAPVVI